LGGNSTGAALCLNAAPGWLNSTIMPASDSPDTRRPRYTLRVLFAAVAVIALVVTWVNTYRIAARNRLLEVENRRLRNEVGALSVEDESQFHAIQIPTNDELEWAWRIWIPDGRSYRVRAVGGQIPKESFPQFGGTITISQPGEHVVRYRIRRGPRDDLWWGEMSASGARVGRYEAPWIEWERRTATTDGVGSSTIKFPPDQRVVLIRYRVSQAPSSDKIEDPATGFLIWLEPN
jgi:hypothetical protein